MDTNTATTDRDRLARIWRGSGPLDTIVGDLLAQWRDRYLRDRGSRTIQTGPPDRRTGIIPGPRYWTYSGVPDPDPYLYVIGSRTDRSGTGHETAGTVTYVCSIEDRDRYRDTIDRFAARLDRPDHGTPDPVRYVPALDPDWNDRIEDRRRINRRPDDPTAVVRSIATVPVRVHYADDGTPYEVPTGTGIASPADVIGRTVPYGAPVGRNIWTDPRADDPDDRGSWIFRAISARPARVSRERVIWCRECSGVGSSRGSVDHLPVPVVAGPVWHGTGTRRPGHVVPCPRSGSTDPADYRGTDLPGVVSGPDTMSAPVTIRRETVRHRGWRFDPDRVGTIATGTTDDGTPYYVIEDGWHPVIEDRREYRTYSRSIVQARNGVPLLRIPDATPYLFSPGNDHGTRSRIVREDGSIGRRPVSPKIRRSYVPGSVSRTGTGPVGRTGDGPGSAPVPWIIRYSSSILDHLTDHPVGMLAGVLPTSALLNADGSVPRPRRRRSRAAIVASTGGSRTRGSRTPTGGPVPDVTDRDAWSRYRDARRMIEDGAIG